MHFRSHRFALSFDLCCAYFEHHRFLVDGREPGRLTPFDLASVAAVAGRELQHFGGGVRTKADLSIAAV